ncbi:MAG TPA: DUF3040 domain-containing protein [Natronosporangium sp.]|nr:DUF3040 domain-containing protein [Natronosporangium sp.]
MPLSEHEQRAFEQIERSLAEDPKFASAVRATDPRVHARRRLAIAVLIILAGLGLVVVGTVYTLLPLGAAGFVVMLAGAAYAMRSHRRAKYPPLQVVDGFAGSTRPSRRRSSLIDRLEERWRRRPEGNR